MTLASAWLGFIVTTRQQPFEAWVATRTNVTPPVGSARGPDNGSEPLSIDVEVQAWSDTDITKQGRDHLTIVLMPDDARPRPRGNKGERIRDDHVLGSTQKELVGGCRGVGSAGTANGAWHRSDEGPTRPGWWASVM